MPGVLRSLKTSMKRMDPIGMRVARVASQSSRDDLHEMPFFVVTERADQGPRGEPAEGGAIGSGFDPEQVEMLQAVGNDHSVC